MRPDVALDVRATSHMSVGMSTYVRELRRILPQAAPELRITTFGRGDNFGVDEQVRLPTELVRLRPRLAHFPTPFVPLVIPVPYVITVHDLIELRYPQYSKPHAVWYYRHVVRRAVRGARLTITDDERMRDELVAAYGIAPARVRVIALGASPAFDVVRAQVNEEAPGRCYLLYVGNHRPHKDLPTLLRAWQRLPAGSACDLYLTGSRASEAAFAAYRRDDARIVMLGEVADERLPVLYARAAAYVHPALSEGFGLPMLEAMRAGTPVIASTSAIPRILEPHAQTFPPGDSDALARLLEAALQPSQERAPRVAAARDAARALTWERCARLTADVYREALRA